MPLAGRKAPADPSQSSNASRLAAWTEVEDVPFEGPWPDLPRTYGDAVGMPELGPWTPPTRRWYNTLKRLPHAVLWRDTDWEYLLATAIIHHRFLAGGSGGQAAATELRRRERELGMTVDARRDLRIRYVPKKTGPELAPVRAIDDVRSL